MKLNKIKTNILQKKVNRNRLNRNDNISLSIMLIPASVFYIFFFYIPMFGVIIAFKDFRYDLGIFGSPWNGFANFKYFFASQDAWILLRNTIGYNFIFICVNMVSSACVALLIYEIRQSFLIKYYQTTMMLPYFMSWVVVGYIVYAFLDPSYGVLNQILGTDINWYSEPKYWPYILVISNTWKGIGMSSLIYYANLLGIDASLFEAAIIDGASKLQQIRHISIPSLRSVAAILFILAVGNILKGDFGLFYQIPMNVGALYPVTDVVDTYIFRGLRSGDIGANAAVGLFQSVVGFFTVLISNMIVKKIDADSAIF